jgi:hypothetical protein
VRFHYLLRLDFYVRHHGPRNAKSAIPNSTLYTGKGSKNAPKNPHGAVNSEQLIKTDPPLAFFIVLEYYEYNEAINGV